MYKTIISIGIISAAILGIYYGIFPLFGYSVFDISKKWIKIGTVSAIINGSVNNSVSIR